MGPARRSTMLTIAEHPQLKPKANTDRSVVMLLISSLERGGAEQQVVELVRQMDRDHFDPFVCSLSSHTPLATALPDPQRDLVVVAKKHKFDVSTVTRVARVMAERNVRIVHAFLFDANFVGRLAGRMARVPIVISSERNTDYQRRRIHSICLGLTRSWSRAMIANSHSGKRFVSRSLGIPQEEIYVVHNGVDVSRCCPGDRSKVRRELSIADEDFVVGMIANFKPQKNHAQFFQMAELVLRRFPRTWFVCVGEPLRDNFLGGEDYHRAMCALVKRTDTKNRLRLLGIRRDMPDVYNACDVTVLTSRHEGTPNVLLESMACGVPVVATDVSDNAYIVRDGYTGFIVPLDDAEATAGRVGDLLADPDRRRAMGRAAREWVEGEFSPARMARKTEAVYSELLDQVTITAS